VSSRQVFLSNKLKSASVNCWLSQWTQSAICRLLSQIPLYAQAPTEVRRNLIMHMLHILIITRPPSSSGIIHIWPYELDMALQNDASSCLNWLNNRITLFCKVISGLTKHFSPKVILWIVPLLLGTYHNMQHTLQSVVTVVYLLVSEGLPSLKWLHIVPEPEKKILVYNTFGLIGWFLHKHGKWWEVFPIINILLISFLVCLEKLAQVVQIHKYAIWLTGEERYNGEHDI